MTWRSSTPTRAGNGKLLEPNGTEVRDQVVPEVAALFVDCVRPHVLRNVRLPAQQVLTQSQLRWRDVRAFEPLLLDLRHRCERFRFGAEPAAHDLLALVAWNRQVDHESPAGAIVAAAPASNESRSSCPLPRGIRSAGHSGTGLANISPTNTPFLGEKAACREVPDHLLNHRSVTHGKECRSPSASRQIPSPSTSAHARRFEKLPSSAMSNAVSR